MKTIHNYRDTEFVRVLKNTTNPYSKKRDEMVGGVFEVKVNYYSEGMVVWNKDKSDFWVFNKEDLQICYPDFTVDGHILGVGDEIKGNYGNIYTVFDIGWWDDGFNIFTYCAGNTSNICLFTPEYLKDFTLHKTVYPINKVEEMTLSEVCKALGKEIKIIKE